MFITAEPEGGGKERNKNTHIKTTITVKQKSGILNFAQEV